ncbi:aromatic amino acid lyase [Listeria aquatica]|uniref:aromatic amino acid lyase n=1 Tax=Listeria aquatica TaxID=1494960 RepID=UPI0031F51629
MGTIAARKARDIVNNSRRVVATEIMAACQALDFDEKQAGKLGKGTQVAYDTFRKSLSFIENDHDIEIYDELEKATEVLTSGRLVKAVEEVVSLELQVK